MACGKGIGWHVTSPNGNHPDKDDYLLKCVARIRAVVSVSFGKCVYIRQIEVVWPHRKAQYKEDPW